jgi:hypothetical protein
MTMRRRLDRLEVARGTRPDLDTAATFTALVATLDRLAARKAAGCVTVQAELETLMAALDGGDNGNAAHAA